MGYPQLNERQHTVHKEDFAGFEAADRRTTGAESFRRVNVWITKDERGSRVADAGETIIVGER